jgi:hypothetical protein
VFWDMAYRCDEHDDADHTGGQERGGVAAHTELFKDRGRIIEYSVDSCPLLHPLVRSEADSSKSYKLTWKVMVTIKS